jgi:hypothetical protein
VWLPAVQADLDAWMDHWKAIANVFNLENGRSNRGREAVRARTCSGVVADRSKAWTSKPFMLMTHFSASIFSSAGPLIAHPGADQEIVHHGQGASNSTPAHLYLSKVAIARHGTSASLQGGRRSGAKDHCV